MWNWRVYLGLAAVGTVLVAMVGPVPALDPDTRIAAVTVAPVRATHDGDVFRGMITVEGKEIPLPPGEWYLSGRTVSSFGQMDPQRPVVSVALVRLHEMAVNAAVLVQTNRAGSMLAWGTPTGCERTDLYFAEIRYASDHDGSCAYATTVNATARFDGVDPAWKEAMLRGMGNGWRFPSRWVEAAYRVTDPRDAIQVRYLFSAASGSDDVALHGEARSLATWTRANWDTVGNGFRNRLDEGASLPDWRPTTSPDAPITPSRTEDEVSRIERASTKLLTYRLFDSLTDFSVYYLWLGSLSSASGLSIASAAAGGALYFVHELVWSQYDKPPRRIGDLPGVGVEGPAPGGV